MFIDRLAFVSLRASDVNEDTVCSYWDTVAQEWQMTGVTIVSVVRSSNGSGLVQVGCASVHLTAFTIGSSALGAYPHAKFIYVLFVVSVHVLFSLTQAWTW